MRAVYLLALLALTAAAQTSTPRFSRFASRSPQARNTRGLLGASYAQLEFAPSSGAGMGSACACAAVTGALGEALTLTRASTATCTKTASGGLATSGIANGDLVTCSAGQPRVEYDGSGVLGLLVESSRTNSILQSQSINLFPWSTIGSTQPVTITADYATAPDGTSTADRAQFSASTSVQDSVVYQSACPVGPSTASVYLKGTSGSGSVDLLINLNGSFACTTCNFVAGSWSRCTVTGTVATSAGNIVIGNEGSVCNLGSRSAQDVLVWGAQCEAGAYVTSYISTTTAATVRAAETAKVTLGFSVTAMSVAASYAAPSLTHSGDQCPVEASDVGVTARLLGWYTSTGAAAGYNGAAFATTAGGNQLLAGNRLALSSSATTATLASNGASASGAGAGYSMTPVVTIGTDGLGARQADGIVSQVCVDSSTTRCQ